MTEYHRAKRLARQHGWNVYLEEWDSVEGCVRAECPPGKILDGDLHERVIPYNVALNPNDKREAWTEACEEMERGAEGALEDCSPENESCYLAQCFPNQTERMA